MIHLLPKNVKKKKHTKEQSKAFDFHFEEGSYKKSASQQKGEIWGSRTWDAIDIQIAGDWSFERSFEKCLQGNYDVYVWKSNLFSI